MHRSEAEAIAKQCEYLVEVFSTQLGNVLARLDAIENKLDALPCSREEFLVGTSNEDQDCKESMTYAGT